MGGGEDKLKGQISQMGHIGQDRSGFSVKARFKSIEYAFAGIRNFLRSQHNAWIHLMGTVVVIFLAVGLHVSNSEAIALTFAVGFVWVSELFNTAIEKIMDFISVEKNQKIKIIKDLSAAAVLIAAITAAVVGCLVFIPKL